MQYAIHILNETITIVLIINLRKILLNYSEILVIFSNLLQNHSKFAATHSNFIDVDIIQHCTVLSTFRLLPLK